MNDLKNSDRRRKLLSLQRLLHGRSPTEVETLLRASVWSVLEAGQIVFLQGDECNRWFIVSEGRIALSFASGSGREVLVGEAIAGDVLGDVELVLGRRHMTNAVATRPTRLLVLRRGAFTDMLREAAFASALLHAVCARWCKLAAFAETMSLHSLEQRLASLLLDLCRRQGRAVGDGVLIHPAVSQTEMARLINASRPKVNVRLHSWKDDALIGLDRRGIVVRDARALAAIAAAC